MIKKKSLFLSLLLISLMFILVSCKSSNPASSTQTSTAAPTGAYIESPISIDSSFKKILNLSTDSEGNLELINLKDGVLEQWILKDNTFSRIDDLSFEGLKLEDPAPRITRSETGDLYVLAKDKVGAYTLYGIEAGKAPKKIPLDFYVSNGIYEQINALCITDSGDFLIGYYKGSLVLYDGKTGQEKNEYAIEYLPDRILCTGNQLIYINLNTQLKGLDLTTNTETFSIQLESLHISCLGLSPDHKSVIYAARDGLFRYLIGGSSVEQIMSGANTSLPLLTYQGHLFASNDKNEFFIGFGNVLPKEQSLKKYSYSKDATKEPEGPVVELTVFDMLDHNFVLQNAIDIFNAKYPNIHVTYKAGTPQAVYNMPAIYNSQQLDLTPIEDATRTLNSQLLSGSGPDIMVLDFLSVEHMAKQNILADLSPVVSSRIKTDDLYESFAKTYEQDGKIYAVPTYFDLPSLVGPKDFVDKATTLSTFADELEKLSQTSKRQLLATSNYADIVTTFYPTCAPTWINEDDTLNRPKLEEFLKETKRIADTCHKNPNQTDFIKFMDWLVGQYDIDLYCLTGPLCMHSYELANKDNNSQIAYLPGQVDHVYLPSATLGVNAASPHQEAAMKFIDFVLSEENQRFLYGNGFITFPINKKVNEHGAELPNGFEDMGGSTTLPSSDPDKTFTCDWPNAQTFKNCSDFISKATTVGASDFKILQIIIQDSKDYYTGTESLEAVMTKLEKKLNIYLAE